MTAVTALATPGHTRVLTTFETRSDDLRQALLSAAAAVPGGCDVMRVEPEQLPEGYRAQHVEVYELRL
jgi:glyoxylase-like metal-dependent hydrolase (beta-lactamase superfamily II)